LYAALGGEEETVCFLAGGDEKKIAFNTYFRK
jgi:hypothetical protein